MTNSDDFILIRSNGAIARHIHENLDYYRTISSSWDLFEYSDAEGEYIGISRDRYNFIQKRLTDSYVPCTPQEIYCYNHMNMNRARVYWKNGHLMIESKYRQALQRAIRRRFTS